MEKNLHTTNVEEDYILLHNSIPLADSSEACHLTHFWA